MLKSTGVVRKIDNHGRIILPIELRRTLGIVEDDVLEICLDQESIILRKHEPVCVFCSNASEIQSFHGKNICRKCAIEMRRII